MRRTKGDHAGKWAFPGGTIEAGETPLQAAIREALEETGQDVTAALGEGDLLGTTGSFETFLGATERFVPKLNDEHDAYRWAPLDSPPAPLHPGVAELLFNQGVDDAAEEAASYPACDYATADGHFYTTASAGKTRSLTPEGFMLCPGAAIARTGTMTYMAADLPFLQPDAEGKIIVERDEADVFDPENMASFEGKPVTILHPRDFVNPDNYGHLAKGEIHNVRRGEGDESDLLLADILVKDAGAIRYVTEKLPDISCGYDAKYKQLAPGRAKQFKMIGNHAAFVPNGRAGDRCAVRDESTIDITQHDTELLPMKLSAVMARLNDALSRKGLRAQDIAEVRAEIEPARATRDADGDDDSDKMMDAVAKAMDAQLKPVRDWMAARDAKDAEEEKKEKEEEQKAKDAAEAEEKKKKDVPDETVDTVVEGDVGGPLLCLSKVWNGKTGDALMTEVRSRAALLAPGFTSPTTDALRGNQGAVLSNYLRGVLKACHTRDAAGKAAVDPFLLGKSVDELRGVQLIGAINGAAELMRRFNNMTSRPTLAGGSTQDGGHARTTDATDYGAFLASQRKTMSDRA